MAMKTMYAYGTICKIVCTECKQNPCPYLNWIKKNTCPKIIEFNKNLGQRCANCMHLVAEKYCKEKANGKKIDSSTDFSKFLINDDIFKHTCDMWTNKYKEHRKPFPHMQNLPGFGQRPPDPPVRCREKGLENPL